MRTSTRAAALAALAVAFLVPAGAAAAEDYPAPNDTPNNPGVVNNSDNDSPRGDNDNDSSGGDSSGGGGSVLPDSNEDAPTAGDETPPAGAPGGAETDDVLSEGETVGAPAAAAAETAPVSGSLPITGGDVVGLSVIGAAAIGLGSVLVRRSRRAATVTA